MGCSFAWILMGTHAPRPCAAGLKDPAAVPFVVADHRHPGQPMASFPIKLPAPALSRLQAQAERLHCSRGALGRALLLCGLDTLEQTAAAEGVA